VAIADQPVSISEGKSLFAPLIDAPAVVLAVSGGPDSTALLILAARWRAALRRGPTLVAVTVNHGLRLEAAREAAAVGRLARKLGVTHRTLRWTGNKPSSGLQEAARIARYRLLSDAARARGASHIVTAHTLDDQAETLLIRITRGSGLTGLGAMAKVTKLSSLPRKRGKEMLLFRPFLDIAKARLIATLRQAKIPFADDPSNRDPRFTRSRLRHVMPVLAQEGLDAKRLALLARRMRRADAALEAAVERAAVAIARSHESDAVVFDARAWAEQPEEVRLRLLGRAVAQTGNEGPVELGKLESLLAAIDAITCNCETRTSFRRTLAGAMVTLSGGHLRIERAPSRRKSRGKKAQAR